MRCAVHNVETALSCGKCDRPICPDCAVFGPAGLRCRDCASMRSLHIYQVKPGRLAAGAVAALVAAMVCGALLGLATGFGFFLLFGGLIAGQMIGETLLRFNGRKRGPKVEVTAVLCAGIGTLAGVLITFMARGVPNGPADLLLLAAHHPFHVALFAVAAFGAFSRIRYM